MVCAGQGCAVLHPHGRIYRRQPRGITMQSSAMIDYLLHAQFCAQLPITINTSLSFLQSRPDRQGFTRLEVPYMPSGAKHASEATLAMQHAMRCMQASSTETCVACKQTQRMSPAPAVWIHSAVGLNPRQLRGRGMPGLPLGGQDGQRSAAGQPGQRVVSAGSGLYMQ